MKNNFLKTFLIIINCFYLIICIGGLYIGLPFWYFYKYLCGVGEKKYKHYNI